MHEINFFRLKLFNFSKKTRLNTKIENPNELDHGEVKNKTPCQDHVELNKLWISKPKAFKVLVQPENESKVEPVVEKKRTKTF